MQKGTLVVVWRDNGEALLTRTRSEVQEVCGTPSVWVKGIAGCYALDAVREVIFHPSTAFYEERTLEAKALQEEGLKLGLVRVYSPKSEVPTCRMCGCTAEQACEGGCYWVKDPENLGNLCSQCLPEATIP